MISIFVRTNQKQNSPLEILFNNCIMFENTDKQIIVSTKENFQPTIIKAIQAKKDYFPNIPNDLSFEYRRFKIPKKKGGFREITEPNPELKAKQREVLNYLTLTLLIPTPEWMFAYTKHRSTLDMAKEHQNSEKFIKLDLKDFFPSLTKEFVTEKLNNITNFNATNRIEDIVNLAIDKKTNSLPQGSPLSPYLSNYAMLETDYEIVNQLKAYDESVIYTRYADDIIISGNRNLNPNKVLSIINETLARTTNGVLKINREKTKVLRTTSKLYIVGIKLNKDHNLTYGHEKKKELKLQLYNLFKGYQYKTVSKEEVQEVLGKFSYMKQIEPEYANYLERKFLKEFNSKAPTIFKHFKF